jgi:copper chaperone CopZ
VVSFNQLKEGTGEKKPFGEPRPGGGMNMKKVLFTIFGALFLPALFSLFLYSGTVIGIALLFPASGYGAAPVRETGTAKVVFKVKCYDEGKAALQGLKGIQKIETGFHYIHETDTVYYNPKVITIREMEEALKKARTYVETIMQKERN